MTISLNSIFSKNSRKIFTLSDQLLVSGSNFLTTIILARLIGTENFGVFTLGWMVVLFTSSFHQAGIITPMLTLGPQKENDQKDDYYSGLFFLQIGFAFIAFFFVFLTMALSDIFWPEWGIKPLKILIPFAVAAFIMHDFFRRFYFMIVKGQGALILDLIAYSIIFISIYWFYNYQIVSLPIIFVCYIIAFSISSIIGFIFYLKKIKSIYSWRDTLKEHWKFSNWLIATALMQWMSGNYFIIMGGLILGPIAVGAIRIIQNIVGLLNVFFMSLENYVPVSASSIFKKYGKEKMLKYLLNFTLKGGLLVVLLISILVIFSDQLIGLLYGFENVKYSYLMPYFGILYVFVFLGLPLRFALRTIRETKHIFIAYAIATVFSLSLAPIIIKNLELNGVVLGLIICQVLMSSWFLFKILSFKKEKLT